MNRDNLKKLADHLRNLPENYEQFEMGTFLGVDRYDTLSVEEAGTYLIKKRGVPCGTVACAVGHGPAAGIFLNSSEIGRFGIEWDAYSGRVFEIEPYGREFDWMFDGGWRDCDNTALGAAKRIDYFLEHGVPGDFQFPNANWVETYQ